MNLLKQLEFIPGVRSLGFNEHESLFYHSIFGAIIFLIVSHTDVYKFVGSVINVTNKNVLMGVHAVVFAVIMYIGSLFILEPLFEVNPAAAAAPESN